MNKAKKVFGGLNITWKRLIIFSICIGIYTGIVAMLPFLEDTSFEDISISFEWWILFGTIIIMNSKSAKESALKCFVFFLISQPIVYLVQLPWSPIGFQILKYYRPWFIWTLFTLPMGYIGYYLKKDKWWGLFILVPVMIFLGFHYSGFLSSVILAMPSHLLSTVFCLVMIFILPYFIFNNRKVKNIGLICSVIIVAVFTFLTVTSKQVYYHTILITSGETYGDFNGDYMVKLKDPEYGKVYIKYIEGLEGYAVEAEFNKPGETELIMESPEGEVVTYELIIKKNSYILNKKEES